MNKAFAITLLALVAGGAGAQSAPRAVSAPRIDFDRIEIRATRLADDLHVLEGHGGAITVLSGADGILMVDSQFAALSGKIIAAIRRFSDGPMRYLVNTHVHADHTGGNASFALLGAQILGREQLRCRLLHPAPGPDRVAPSAAPAAALPVVTFDAPVTLHFDGEDVQLIPIRAAHTDGDTLVRFVKHDVLAVGDYYRSVQYPFVDTQNGGTLDGMLAGLEQTIALAGPETKIVPGHGHIVGRDALIAQRDLIMSLRDLMRPLVAKGMTLEQVLAAALTRDTDASIADGPRTAERFVRWMYAELSGKREVHACDASHDSRRTP